MARTSLEAMCQTLKYDICDLRNPASEIQIDLAQIPDQLRSIAYSCVYWVEHLVRGCSSEGTTAEDVSKDDGILHSFLTVKYLCWLESLALLRSVKPHGAVAIEKLKNWAASSYGNQSGDHHLVGLKGNTNCLRRFISDADDFFHSCKDYVKYWPLQLYYSAIVFENQSSAIYKTFRQPIQAHFGNSLAILKQQRIRFSLQQRIPVQYYVDKLVYSWDASALCVLSHSDSKSHSIVVYRADTMKQTNEWGIDYNHDLFVSFLPDSKHLVSVSFDGIVQTWAIDNRTEPQRCSLNLPIHYASREGLHEQVISLSPHGIWQHQFVSQDPEMT